MVSKRNRIEIVLNELSQSVLRLSDDDILVEVSAASQDPTEEAKRVRDVLQRPLQTLEKMNLCLSNLGHAIDSANWKCGPLMWHNTCIHCGLAVDVTIATSEIRGSAVQKGCYANCSVTRRTGTVS